jgi:beta-glucosidase
VPLDDPDVLKLVGGTTMGKFAYFGMGLDQEAIDEILRTSVSD